MSNYKTTKNKNISYGRADDDAWRNRKAGQKKLVLVHLYREEVRVSFDDPSLDRPRMVGFVETTCDLSTGHAERLLCNGRVVWARWKTNGTFHEVCGYAKDGTPIALKFTATI